MKKIGLLTFHFPINYGAVLQTYGLYTYLKKKGFVVTLINYYADEHADRYNFYHRPESIKNLFYYFIKTVFLCDFVSKKKKFDAFRNKHFKLTKKYQSVSEISFSWDIVLTGSDQVFNINHADRITYFQPFNKKANQIKAAYAPSFGIHDLNDRIKTRISELVMDFDFISCRESIGAQFLSEIIGKKAEHVLDPVFLLDAQEWSSIASKRLVKEKYLFVYDLNGKKPLIDIAKKISSNHKIVVLSNDPIASFRKAYHGVDVFIKSAGIEDFISLINFSDAVITDSFHGTVLSIIFEKPFYSYIALENASSRIIDILTTLSMESRLVKNIEDVKEIGKFNKPQKLEEMITVSKKFLQQLA